ncbi:MAG TPA: DUF302 domain-containing protein [Alphaproteobacteria bacterium]|nr:DUF302 domain-containing protein [Alphaproteobacteria bacterium]
MKRDRRLRCADAACVLLIAAVLLSTPCAKADVAAPYPGTQTVATKHAFDVLVERLERAIERNRMGLVAQASASRGAAARGLTIPGNAVLMVFRNDFAVRMLAANVPAGIEAPIRIYVTENADGMASVTYRSPSAVFAPYKNAELDALGRELDPIFARIVRDAIGD